MCICLPIASLSSFALKLGYYTCRAITPDGNWASQVYLIDFARKMSSPTSVSQQLSSQMPLSLLGRDYTPLTTRWTCISRNSWQMMDGSGYLVGGHHGVSSSELCKVLVQRRTSKRQTTLDTLCNNFSEKYTLSRCEARWGTKHASFWRKSQSNLKF